MGLLGRLHTCLPARQVLYCTHGPMLQYVITLLARQVLGDRELGKASVGVEVLERGKVELEVLAAGYG